MNRADGLAVAAVLLIGAGVFLVFGIGWSLIALGAFALVLALALARVSTDA